MRRFERVLALTLGASGLLLADFSYEQTSRMTGGAMMSMMKVMGAFSSKAREPQRSAVSVKGNRMATISADSAHIVDLDKETITEVHFQKKTYSVVTFAQMKEALAQMERKLRSQKGDRPEVEFKASVKETGQTRQIGGLTARQSILAMVMESADPQSAQKGGMTVTVDMWLAPSVSGYEEVKNFQLRMAEKLNWTPGGGMFTQGQSGMGKAFANVAREGARMDGVPVLQITRMGGKADGAPAAGEAPAQQPPPSQAQEPQPTPQPTPTAGGALGRLGGGRFGGLGGLGRKKQAEPQAQPAAQQQPPPASGQPAADPGVLMEMTSELSNFSPAAVDPAKLDVPSGFKQVESETLKAMRR